MSAADILAVTAAFRDADQEAQNETITGRRVRLEEIASNRYELGIDRYLKRASQTELDVESAVANVVSTREEPAQADDELLEALAPSAMREDREEYPPASCPRTGPTSARRSARRHLPPNRHRSFGKGLFHKAARERRRNRQMKRLFATEGTRPGVHIVSAREGAAALAGPAEHGECGARTDPHVSPRRDAVAAVVRRAVLLSPSWPDSAPECLAWGSVGRNKTLNETWQRSAGPHPVHSLEQHDVVDALDAVVNAVSAALVEINKRLPHLDARSVMRLWAGSWEEVRPKEVSRG